MTIGRVVADHWLIAVSDVEYAPIGYGSYHWHVWGLDGARWLVTFDRMDERPIREAYQVASELAADLTFVRGPALATEGAATIGVDGWWVSLWPWLDGRVGDHSTPRSGGDLVDAARCLRMLHDHQRLSRVPELEEDWAIPRRDQLLDLMDPARSVGEKGPYAQEALGLLGANESKVRDLFARYDELVAIVSVSAELVVTHGEPHPGNVVHSADGMALIDWDTVRWAPRERDLWALGRPAEWRHSYGTDVALSTEAMDLYQLQWTLVDVADFVPDLVQARETTPDLDIAMREVRKYLSR